MNAMQTDCLIGEHLTIFFEPRSDGRWDFTIQVEQGMARQLYDAFESAEISIAERMRDRLLTENPSMKFEFAEIIGEAIELGVFDTLGIDPDGDDEDDD